MKSSRTPKSTTQRQYLFALIILGVVVLVSISINIFMKSFDLRSRAVSLVAQEQTMGLIRASRALQNASASDKNRAQEVLIDIAAKREQTMLSLMDTNPAEVLKIALPASVKQGIPLALRSSVEEEVTLEGQLDAFVADDFAHGKSKNLYVLTSGGKRYSLHFTNEGPLSDGGATVRVRGVALKHDVAIDANAKDTYVVTRKSPGVLGASTDGSVLGVSSNQKVAVILFNFSNNSGSKPFTQDQARSIVFTGTLSAGKYYPESSFGKTILSGKLRTDGDIFGWYTIPNTNSTCTSDDVYAWKNAADAKAQAAGVDLTGYTNFMYVFPDASSCGWGGLGQVNGSISWVNGGAFQASRNYNAAAHELGHNFGAGHASTYLCYNATGGRVRLSSDCKTDEYGDPFDLMGYISMTGSSWIYYDIRQMNNYHKGRFNWFTPSNTKLVTTGGTFTLAPIEHTSTGLQVLQIPKFYDANGNVTKYYYVEYRQPAGTFDNFSSTAAVVNGVSIRIAPPYPTISNTWLLDMTPGTSTYTDSALAVGASFTDSSIGMNIKTNSVSSTGASVTVTYTTPPCVLANPTVSISPLGQWGDAGQTLTYALTVTNNNNSSNCPNATFSVAGTLPSGWTQTASNLTLASGATGTTNVLVTSPASAVEGTYTFTETVTNTGSPTYKSSTTANYNVLAPPPPPTPTPTPTPMSTLTPTPTPPAPTPNTNDTTPPVVTISSPLNNAALGQNGSLKINTYAQDGSGISQIQIFMDSTLIKTCSAVTTCTASQTLQKISAGSHIIKATATDASANRNVGTTQITVTK